MVNPECIFGRIGNRLFQYAYIHSQFEKGEIPDIFVQNEKYITEGFKKLLNVGPEKIDKVAIHVRRGDYVDNPFYVDLTQTDYYEKAMQQFPNKQFLVFSDDIEWCKDYFFGDEYEFCYINDPIIALEELASCTGHIIANSSFSYWGAVLSPHEGIVVAPREWYSDKQERTICPTNWIRL